MGNPLPKRSSMGIGKMAVWRLAVFVVGIACAVSLACYSVEENQAVRGRACGFSLPTPRNDEHPRAFRRLLPAFPCQRSLNLRLRGGGNKEHEEVATASLEKHASGDLQSAQNDKKKVLVSCCCLLSFWFPLIEAVPTVTFCASA